MARSDSKMLEMAYSKVEIVELWCTGMLFCQWFYSFVSRNKEN